MKSYLLGSVALGAFAVIALHPWTLFAATSNSVGTEGDSCERHQTADAANQRQAVPEDGSPALGPQDAPVTVVEFTDYSCPYCKRADATISALRREYGNKLRWIVKQDPLPMHEHAKGAAMAALAAQEQGKFFEMHAALFSHSDSLEPAKITQYATTAGLDVQAFNAATQDKALERSLERDEALAHTLQIQGVPYFLVNGRALEGAQPKEAFEKIIDDELKKR